jgi:hypothetical protein
MQMIMLIIQHLLSLFSLLLPSPIDVLRILHSSYPEPPNATMQLPIVAPRLGFYYDAGGWYALFITSKGRVSLTG